jgi:hypothetical protein
MGKGTSTSASNALSNAGVGNAYSSGYQNAAGGVQSAELPFLQNELFDPQGFGQPALQPMQTQGGQSVAGATGAADEQAQLLASRTGNTAAVPGIIDATARNAMKQQSGNVLGTDIANAQLKQQQQQEGSAGLEKMFGTDVSAALQSLGLSNQAIADSTQASNDSENALQNWTKLGLGVAGTGAGAVAGAVGGGGGAGDMGPATG